MGLLDHVRDTDLFDSRELYDARDNMEDEDQQEYDEFAAEVEGYAGDTMRDGIGFIADHYFETYARELADDIGAVDGNASWPNSHIDWEAAADALKADYITVEIDGTTYYYR